MALTRGAQRGARGRAGGDAVVGDDRRPARHIDALAIATITPTAALDLGKLTIAHRLEILLIDAGEPNDLLIAHDERCAAVDDCPHGQLRLHWHADLTHQNEIERRLQGCRRLGGDCDTAARQRQHDRALAFVAGEGKCELPTGVGTILERHDTLPTNASSRADGPARGFGHKVLRATGLARLMSAASAGLTKTWLMRGTISSALPSLRGLAATPARAPLRSVRIPKLGPALTVRPAHFATAPEREPGFHFDRLPGNRVRLECPLAKRVLDGLALRFGRTDHTCTCLTLPSLLMMMRTGIDIGEELNSAGSTLCTTCSPAA